MEAPSGCSEPPTVDLALGAVVCVSRNDGVEVQTVGSRLGVDARPGPATAHGHRSLARCFLWASRGSRVLSFWGAWVRVVTNVVNPRAFSLKMVVFGLRLTTFVTGVLAR